MQNRVIALGCFDGVHLGHAALLTEVCRQSARLGAVPSAVTFDVPPRTLVAGDAVALLTAPAERERLMHLCGIEEMLTLHFDNALRQMPWQTFAQEILCNTYHAAALVCGEDFRFGAGGAGTAALLSEFCRERGLGCTVLPKVQIGGEVVSSTRIRALIASGDMAAAVQMLGHPHTQVGTVQHGNALGRTIGVPTANVPFAPGIIVPAFGAYAAEVFCEGKCYRALVNVGVHPTVCELAAPIAEAWIQDFDGDLYGKALRISYLRRLRGERKFGSLAELKAQLASDAAEL